MQQAAIIAVPIVLILLGMVLSRGHAKSIRGEVTNLRGEITNLRAEMLGRFSEVMNRFNTLESDMRRLYYLTGKLEGRLDVIERKSLTR